MRVYLHLHLRFRLHFLVCARTNGSTIKKTDLRRRWRRVDVNPRSDAAAAAAAAATSSIETAVTGVVAIVAAIVDVDGNRVGGSRK
jgi:hypothetical protein